MTSFPLAFLEVTCEIQQACQIASGLSGANPLELCRQIYLTQDAWCRSQAWPALLVHFDTCMVERTILDAWCRQRQIPFFDLLLQGDLGIDANWF